MRSSAPGNGANLPHHHDYEELIVAAQGSLEHFIDFRTEVMDAPFVSFVTKGKVHRVKPTMKDGACDMWVLRFKSEFIPETTFQLYSFYHDNANIQLKEARCFVRLTMLCEMIAAEMGQQEPDLAVVRQLLSTLFTLISSERRKLHPDGTSQPATHNETFRNFLRILEENFRQEHEVEFYARRLPGVRNLNLIPRTSAAKACRAFETRANWTQAKNLLIGTDKPWRDAGPGGLGGAAPPPGVKKKEDGATPTEFREEMRKLVA
ncbi:MAG: AraC family transcriptional regulator [Flavobacteriales bacterium]|nr:AraC family transcriptional regulator [Flavobacteriales bacterium]